MVPYRRKRTYRRKSTLKRLTKPRKTTAIQTLAKQVMGIKRQMKVERPLLNYQWGTRQDPGGATGIALSQPITYFQFSYVPGWGRIFGTSANDEECNSVIWKSFGMDLHIRSFNETDQVNFTMFVVSLKKEAAPFYNAATGALTLTDGQEYINTSATGSDTCAGLVMLNKRLFNIHYVKRFTLGNNGAALNISGAQTQFGTDRRFYAKFSPNRKITNPYGDWKAATPAEITDNYYLLIFNNNSTADAESPRMFLNTVHTVQQLA